MIAEAIVKGKFSNFTNEKKEKRKCMNQKMQIPS